MNSFFANQKTRYRLSSAVIAQARTYIFQNKIGNMCFDQLSLIHLTLLQIILDNYHALKS